MPKPKMGLFKSLKSNRKRASSSPPSSTEQSPRQSSSNAQTQAYTTHQRNVSTSNLSTTSTLTDTQTSKQSRPAPPSRLTSYEAFLYQARLDVERKEAQEHAWRVAAQRRQDGSMWPSDPWRGGFGPPVPKKGGGVGGNGVEGWVAATGLRR